MPRFFIDRPIFAWVIALTIALAGVMALRSLAIEQYPDIAPPSLTISAAYPGADAATVEQNVTQVIEQQLNGVEGLLYTSSSSQSNGSASINATFEAGTDIDVAQTEVQNRLSTVESRLPEEVRRQGVTVRQASSNFLMIAALTSKSGSLSSTDLGDVANNQIIDELRRVPGVGDIRLLGSAYAMRIWLDPHKLASYSLSPSAVLAAVQEQNSQTAGGSIGAQPFIDDQQITASIVAQGRLTTVEEFEGIILRTDTGGATVRLGDVARVELGAQSYASATTLNGDAMAGMAIMPATGANALDTAKGVRQRLDELQAGLPADVEAHVPYDTTPFIELSVEEVLVTLMEAMALVFLVMFLFLQNWRATVIPALVVPIALSGACLGLWLFGFTINVLSLFGMVLAIGILVDDAIVVIENVERIMAEEGLGPVEATRKAMDQITGAVIGITLVLIAVFIPMAFFPGSTGGIYRQFSVTLAISIFFSAVLALTLTPALCATFLKPRKDHVEKEENPEEAGQSKIASASEVGEEWPESTHERVWRNLTTKLIYWQDRLFASFNRWFERQTKRYERSNERILAAPLRGLAVFVAMCVITLFLFTRLPTSFLPAEDQGDVLTVIQAPPGATMDRTEQAVQQVEKFWTEQPAVENVIAIRGFSFYGQGQNNAMLFVGLKDWSERTSEESSAGALTAKAMGAFSQLDQAIAFAIQRPPISSLGSASGFSMKLEDRGGLGREALNAASLQLLGLAAQSKIITGVRPEEQQPAPQLRLDIDRVQARALGLSLSDVNAALSINFGSAYANDFTRNGRILQVLVQADAPYRMQPEDVMALRIPNAQGELVPFSSFATVKWSAAPPSLSRYNGYPALTISGQAAPGESSGTALAEMERLAQQLPAGIGYEWTGISFEEKQSAGQIGMLLGLSVVVVFLLLAALYESWSVPLAVLLIVPAGVLGAVLFSLLRGLSADVYFNVGMITIIGLAAKNAILIVEFAIEEEEAGKNPLDAVKAAARLRLRPIVMTSLAFVMGMVPLVIASGAGAASRIAVGTGVMGGMIAATAIGIFLIPVLYLSVRRFVSKKQPAAVGHLEEDDA